MIDWLARMVGAIWFLSGMFGVSWAYGFLIAEHGAAVVFDYSDPSRIWVTFASFILVAPGLLLYAYGEYLQQKRFNRRRDFLKHHRI